jgi:hypothetical protein
VCRCQRDDTRHFAVRNSGGSQSGTSFRQRTVRRERNRRRDGMGILLFGIDHPLQELAGPHPRDIKPDGNIRLDPPRLRLQAPRPAKHF